MHMLREKIRCLTQTRLSRRGALNGRRRTSLSGHRLFKEGFDLIALQRLMTCTSMMHTALWIVVE